jgi:thiol-disulfide isomerase/thioredoxin
MTGALALALAALMAGCTGSPPTSASGATAGPPQAADVHVDVDTPELRQLKQEAGIAPCPDVDAEPVEGGLPPVTLPCLGGGPDVPLGGVRGPAVVNLFAQWCGPCRAELPYFEELHRKGRGTVGVLGVDYLDTRPDKALELVRDTGVTYPLLADPGGALRTDLRIRGLPGVAFVGADGSVQVQFGVVDSYAELRAMTEKQLGVRLPS